MRPGALRPATAVAADKASPKLGAGLSNRVSHAARCLLGGSHCRVGSPPNHAGIFHRYPEFGIKDNGASEK